MKFVHAADLHLDSPMRGLAAYRGAPLEAIRGATRQAFESLIELCIEERAGLLVTDIEILRLHYAATLRAWRERFLAHRETVEKLYDLRFVRMWEFYLAASEMAFARQNMMVFQLQLTKRQGTVPITRDYIGVEETRLRALEGRRRVPMRLAGE